MQHLTTFRSKEEKRVTDDDIWYVFLDEVQMCKGFESVLNGLNRKENLDIYA